MTVMTKGYSLSRPVSRGVSPRPGSLRTRFSALPSEMFQPTLTCNKVDLGERRPQMIFQKINQSPESGRILQQGADIAAKRGRAVRYLRGLGWLLPQLLSPGEAGGGRAGSEERSRQQGPAPAWLWLRPRPCCGSRP